MSTVSNKTTASLYCWCCDVFDFIKSFILVYKFRCIYIAVMVMVTPDLRNSIVCSLFYINLVVSFWQVDEVQFSHSCCISYNYCYYWSTCCYYWSKSCYYWSTWLLLLKYMLLLLKYKLLLKFMSLLLKFMLLLMKFMSLLLRISTC